MSSLLEPQGSIVNTGQKEEKSMRNVDENKKAEGCSSFNIAMSTNCDIKIIVNEK